jgi:hypothetical protein
MSASSTNSTTLYGLANSANFRVKVQIFGLAVRVKGKLEGGEEWILDSTSGCHIASLSKKRKS